MKILNKILRSFFVLVVIMIVLIFYSFKIEPFLLKVEKIDLGYNESILPIKIIQVSDIHIKENFTYKNLQKVVDEINNQNADIVIFTGDLYDNYAIYNDNENIIEQLKNINANYEKIAIWGNRDYGGGASRVYEDIMSKAGFKLLKNENLYININNKSIVFTGLDDSLLGNPNLPNINENNKIDYRILLTHEPDVVDIYGDIDYNLILSGHSHGGQVNIPFIKPLTTKLAEKYIEGIYYITDNKKLYVNSGIGTTHISARFGVIPKITLFNIYL